MNVSLTPELERIVKEKVASGLYNNASEVIREALRFMETHEELVYRMKLDSLRHTLAEGERDFAAERYREITPEGIAPLMQELRERAWRRLKEESV